MPVRIYDISKKLGLEVKEIIAKAKQMGVAAARVPSSSLDKISAEWLEEELLKDHPEIAARLAPKPAPEPPGPRVGAKVGFVQLSPSRAPTQPPVRISEVANKVRLPIDQVQTIVKEFSIPVGPAPDLLNEDAAQELMQLVQSGKVVEKRLSELEAGGRTLVLRGFSLRKDWISRICLCKHIQELNLSNTDVSTLPDEFAELKELSLLDVSGSNLKELPNWLLDFPKLKALYLHGNAALNLPTEILGPASREAEPAKPRDILDYYFRLQSGGKRPLNEAKLILLGRGEVGKTCLIN